MKLKILGSVLLFAAAGAAPASDAEADPQFFDPAGFPAPIPSAFPVMDGDQRYVAQMMQGSHQFMGGPMMPPHHHAANPPSVAHEMPFAPQPTGPHNMVAGHGFESSVHEMPPQFMDQQPHHPHHQMATPPAAPHPGQFNAPEMAMSHPYTQPAPQMPFVQPGPNSAAPFTTANQPFYEYSLPSNCQREEEIIMTGSCKPSLENVCNTETLQTEEIKYEKVCRDVVNYICGSEFPQRSAVGMMMNKREAEAVPEAKANADADAQFFQNDAAAAVAVPNSAISSVKSACQEVTTEYCFDSPRVEIVPVEVEHCHQVTKANCEQEETPVPKITCQPVEQTLGGVQSNQSPDYDSSYDNNSYDSNSYDSNSYDSNSYDSNSNYDSYDSYDAAGGNQQSNQSMQ